MGYDPDLQPHIDEFEMLKAAFAVHEHDLPIHDHPHDHPGTPQPDPLPIQFPFSVYGPNTSARTVNDSMRDMWLNKGGGWIILTGRHRPEQPYVMQPGVKLHGASMPMMYRVGHTTVAPTFSNDPVFIIEDGLVNGKKEAWGGSQLWDIQIDANTPGLTAISMVGGNGSDVRNVMSSYGTHPLEYGLRVQQGRQADGQYSDYTRLRFTRVRHGFTFFKNAPDSNLHQCMAYGADLVGSTGLDVRKGSNNLEVSQSHFQFLDKPIVLDSSEVEITGGSIENRSHQQQWATAAFTLGPNAKDITVRSLSIANLTSWAKVFDLDPAARRYTFEYLSGHVDASDVPAGMGDHFVWHK